jgi:serine/threonine protein kinase
MAGLFSSDAHDSGVIPLLAAWCEHGVRPACGESPEDVFLAMPLAITDFGHAPWPSIPLASRLALLRYTLLGIARIHAAGIIHRDVSVKNLLVRSLDPPVAAVCDFGKATDRPHSTNTAIGPIETVAPEVWMSAPHNPYGRSVDMWSLGYAWLSTFGHLRGIVSASGSLKTDATRALGIRRELDRRARSGAMPADLGNLLRQMMDVDPRQRYTAEQALRHPTWNLLSKTVSDEGGDRAKRRRLLTPEEEEPVGACPADESTIPDTEASLAATVQIPGRPGESAVV